MGCGSSSEVQDTNNNNNKKINESNTKPNNNNNNNKKNDQSNANSNKNNNKNIQKISEEDKNTKRKIPEEENWQEPENEDVTVPPTERGYPAATVPPGRKDDIFNMNNFRHIEERARNTPPDKAETYEALIDHLTSGLQTDLEKLRAIFIWLGSQNMDGADYSKVTSSDSPIGFMKLIKESRGSYASFFTLLCRAAKLKCVIIRGIAKSAAYEVGMSEEKCQTLKNSWTAVYVEKGWRLVFPLWACKALVGHSLGTYTKVEEKGQAVRHKEQAASGETIRHLNEYFFLTDPEEFIFMAYPDDKKWQLIGNPWSLSKFIDVPECEQNYFQQKLQITSRFSGKLHTVDGECEVTIQDQEDNLSLSYELYFNHLESGKDISPTLQPNNYVLMMWQDKNWIFRIRFPESGVYKLTVIGGYTPSDCIKFCSFKILCEEAKEDCHPFPTNPDIGYGPNKETEKAGIQAKSHTTGIVYIVAYQEVNFAFHLIKNVEVTTTLVHCSMSEEQLKTCVKQKIENRKMQVGVRVPENGEYALQMFTRDKNSNKDFANVCNYLLTSETKRKKKKRNYETPIEKNARSAIQEKTHSRDIEGLEKAIEKFQRLELDEKKGELIKANDALEFKKVQHELGDAINRRHLETLDKAIQHGHESRFKPKLENLIKEAEDVRDHLRQLNRFAHEILEMKQTTIAELRSYKNPPEVVKDVMTGTFLMLGERKDQIEVWEDHQYMMGKLGKESLIRRVQQFDTVNVQPETFSEVEELIKDHDETSARLASAGCGTFYVWLKNVLSTVEKKPSDQ
ncbi:hypothetical protein CHS0354_009835 [Potamilus streckersoni]|uniref:Kyphoscoliosis peptidase n=1 Tax=Potamilus streckersoni TaxID=2493646 RepID=A0AAE0W3P4_9BIVA|nr:hypothetical protein CHS0354_009835 [Potamilus streckersoni]